MNLMPLATDGTAIAPATRFLASLTTESPSRYRRIASAANEVAMRLRNSDVTQLAHNSDQLRREFAALRKSDALMATAAGTVIEAVRRSDGIELYPTQIHAGLAMCDGRIVEMATGEGKTFAGLLPAYVLALAGQGVHVCTPNTYLANRDRLILAPTFALLGMTTAVRNQNDSLQVTRRAYDADVTYGPGQLFGFDYLRDQWTRRQTLLAPLGSATITRLSGQTMQTQLRMRSLYAALVDEADQVLVDDATSPLLITSADNGRAPDTALHHAARSMALTLSPERDYHLDLGYGGIQLSDRGFRQIYENEELATHEQLNRPWHAYVIAALKAELLLRRDKHYVVVNDEIRLVEQSTGRVFTDRSWSDGLHQAIQTKERLPVTAETESQGRITRQAFFRLYENLCGMTGTAQSCREELRSIYGLKLATVATRLPSRRQVLPLVPSLCERTKLAHVMGETFEMIRRGRSVLIGTNHIDQTRRIADALIDVGIRPRVLNGIQSEEEADVIAAAGQSGAVTVATHLAGRGTDIKLDETVARAGGLHVIAWEHHRLARVDRQLIGRGARQGDPGTARFHISPDDQFVSSHAPYLADAVVRAVKNPGTIVALTRSILSAQNQLESEDRKMRYRLMKQNARAGKAITNGGSNKELKHA